MDGMNVSLPFPDRPAEDFNPWPHVDQSPLVTDLHCVQGIVNLAPNGPMDGGLMVSAAARSSATADDSGTERILGVVWKAL